MDGGFYGMLGYMGGCLSSLMLFALACIAILLLAIVIDSMGMI